MKKIRPFFLILFTLLASAVDGASSNAGKPLGVTDYSNVSPDFSNSINQKLEQKKYHEALAQIDTQLTITPNNTALLYKEASIYADLEDYKQAIENLKKITAIQPNNKKAISLLNKMEILKRAEPHNEIGFLQDEAYVSDLNSVWAYSTLHYYRLTDYGKFGARINYSNRFGTTGEQYQLEAYPILFKGAYADLAYAMANGTQILFPNNQSRAELYFTLPKDFEISLGERYLRYQSVYIYTYTGSLNKYFGNYLVWIRPYSYVPRAVQLYEVGLRRYFSSKDAYIGVKIDAGKYPDIGTIVPLSQLVIVTNAGINVDGQYPLTKTLLLKGGLGFARQTFSGLSTVRKITDVSIGIAWRF